MSLTPASAGIDLLLSISYEFNANPDINSTLRNVLTTMHNALDASGAFLILVDKNGVSERSIILSNSFPVQAVPKNTLQALFDRGLIGWVTKSQKETIVTDTQTDERWYRVSPTPAIQQARSAIAAPIQRWSEEMIGVMGLINPEPNHFNQSDLSLLGIVANQAAFALANAALIQAEQSRRRLGDTLSAIANTVNSTLDLDEVLHLILKQLSLVIEYDSSSVLLYEDNHQFLAVHAARGFEDMEDALRVRLPFDENIPNFQAILQKRPIAIGDVDADPYWIKSSSSARVKSWIGVPLLARNEVVGILTVDHYQPHKYTGDNVTVVAAFADHAAIAVANAQAVARLKEAEISYTALFEDSTDMIVLTDYDGTISNINRKGCQILKRPKDAVLGMKVSIISPALQRLLNEQTKRLQVWRESTVEIEILNSYREKVPLEVHVRHIQVGQHKGVEWVGRDISQRKEVEKMRQDLVNMLVHDIKGPLGNLINTLDLVSMMVGAAPDNENLTRFLEMGKRTGRTLSDLVDSMLDVGRLEQGDVPVQRSSTNMAELLATVREQVQAQAQARATQLTFSPEPAEISLHLFIDSNLIRRVLTNLVSNAIKYSPEEAQVTLTTRIETDKLYFVISDNGPGILPEDQKRIFEKFTRLNHAAGGPSGVGLGLAFCKLAIEAHGGTISIDSEGVPGQGSTFNLCIPISAKPE
jgi:PAS domain S-box-containing protein